MREQSEPTSPDRIAPHTLRALAPLQLRYRRIQLSIVRALLVARGEGDRADTKGRAVDQTNLLQAVCELQRPAIGRVGSEVDAREMLPLNTKAGSVRRRHSRHHLRETSLTTS